MVSKDWLLCAWNKYHFLVREATVNCEFMIINVTGFNSGWARGVEVTYQC